MVEIVGGNVRQLRLIYGKDDWGRPQEEEHGFGVDFLLGTSIVRVEMEVGTGRIAMGYFNRETDQRLTAAWRVRRVKDPTLKRILGGIGIVLGEITDMDRPAQEVFYTLRAKMKRLLEEEGEGEEDDRR